MDTFFTTTVPMSSLYQSIRRLFSITPVSAQDRDERYLADATDIHDLERRMRQVDSGRHNLYAIGSYGILMR